MSSENRIWTQNLNQELTEKHVNDLQDSLAMFWELDGSTLAPATALLGLTEYYGQHVTAVPVSNFVVDASRDWRYRMLDIRILEISIGASLPKEAGPPAYDPDTSTSFARNIMYTGAGDTGAGPGGGVFWTFRGNTMICAASVTAGGVNQGELFIHTAAGAPANKFMIWVEQTSIAS